MTTLIPCVSADLRLKQTNNKSKTITFLQRRTYMLYLIHKFTSVSQCMQHFQEHGKQQQRRVVSMKPQGSPKRPQSQESPGRRSQSQVTVAQANSTMKPQASPAQKIPKENPAGQSQGILIQNGFTLQSTGLISK